MWGQVWGQVMGRFSSHVWCQLLGQVLGQVWGQVLGQVWNHRDPVHRPQLHTNECAYFIHAHCTHCCEIMYCVHALLYSLLRDYVLRACTTVLTAARLYTACMHYCTHCCEIMYCVHALLYSLLRDYIYVCVCEPNRLKC